jgi:hypothetical protein
MDMKRPRATIVDHTIYGIYMWQLPDGGYFHDGEGNFLSIAAVRGDLKKISRLAESAKIYGQPEGRPVFFAGRRKITDEEHGEQLERMKNGLIPDPYDAGAYIDEMKFKDQHG